MTNKLTLKQFQDKDYLLNLLTAHKMSPDAAGDKAEIFIRLASNMVSSGRTLDTLANAYFVPGRIEVLGKHTDYCGGRTMVTAVDRGFCLIVADRADAKMNIFAAEMDESVEFEISADLEPTLGHWSNYPMTTAHRLACNFDINWRGMDIYFSSDLPAASGISSSSALIVAMYHAIAGVNDIASLAEYQKHIYSAETLAGYLGTIENGQSFGELIGDKGVGTFGGSEDHTAIMCCQPGQLSQYSYCPVVFERRIEIPSDYIFLIASSGVDAKKTGAALGKYNRASLLSRATCQAWRRKTGRNDAHLASIIRDDEVRTDEVRQVLSDTANDDFHSRELVQRFEHFVTESEEIIPEAGDALIHGDLKNFGRMVDLSQALAESLLGNQVPETIFLARNARELGAGGASSFGAGFGGSVWSLVRRDDANNFLKRWRQNYIAKFPVPGKRSSFFKTEASNAAFSLGE